jgi:hypothetical protein
MAPGRQTGLLRTRNSSMPMSSPRSFSGLVIAGSSWPGGERNRELHERLAPFGRGLDYSLPSLFYLQQH